MIITLVSILVMLLGLIVYLAVDPVAPNNAKVLELSRSTFFVGLFMSVLPYVGKLTHGFALTALVSVVVGLIGLIVYLASTKAKLLELSRITFFVGLFMTVLPYVGKIAHLP